MAPSSDYSSAIGGGLKLKGTAGSAGIDKKKKKKHKKKDADGAAVPKVEGGADREVRREGNEVDDEEGPSDTAVVRRNLQAALEDEDERDENDRKALDNSVRGREDGGGGMNKAGAYKTEAQRKYEERRRQRLDERLRREGVQTHKERVEQLNKYLSGLSEHHDMPRIGPG